MEFAGVRTMQQVIDEVVRQVWAQRHPDRPGEPDKVTYVGDPEVNELRNLVREIVFRVAQEEATPNAVLPPVDSEWEDQQRLARIAALAYTRTGF
jgi:hypothetical protein